MTFEDLINLYDALMADGKTEEAGKILKAALIKAKESENKAFELSVQNEMVGYCRQAKDKKGGLLAVTEALSILHELGIENTVDGGTVLLNCATALASFNDVEKSIECFDRAIVSYEKNLDPSDKLFAALYNNSSAVYELKGDYEKAEELCVKALSILEKYNDLMDKAVTFVNLARLYHRQRRNEEEIAEMFRKSLECLNSPDAVWDTYYAHTCRKCAGAFEDAGLKEEAKELMDRVNEVMESMSGGEDDN